MPKWLANSFSRVFQLAGYDENWERINGVKVKDLDAESYQTALIYYQHPLIRILTFFGFPMRIRYNQKLTVLEMLKSAALNLVGWPQENAGFLARWIQIILAVAGISLASNLLSVVFSTSIHVVMLFTEFLPLVIQQGCNELNKHADNRFIGFLAGLSGFLHFIGRATTSPITGVRQAWEEGKEYGLLTAGLSFLVTVATWSLLAIVVVPVVLPVLPQAFAYLSTNFPALMNGLSWIYTNMVSPVISPLLNLLYPWMIQTMLPWIGMTAAPWLTTLLGLFGYTGVVSPFAVAFSLMGAVVAAATATVGTLLNLTFNAIGNAFTGRREKEKSIESNEDELTHADIDTNLSTATLKKLFELNNEKKPEFETLTLNEGNETLLDKNMAYQYNSLKDSEDYGKVVFIDDVRRVNEDERAISFKPQR